MERSRRSANSRSKKSKSNRPSPHSTRNECNRVFSSEDAVFLAQSARVQRGLVSVHRPLTVSLSIGGKMNAKQITIAVAGTGGKKEFRDVSILPGTKSRDVLAKLDLNGFQLAKPDGG